MRSSESSPVEFEDLEQRLCMSSAPAMTSANQSTAGAHHAAAKHALQARPHHHHAGSATGNAHRATVRARSGVTFFAVTDLITGRIEQVPVDVATGMIVTDMGLMMGVGTDGTGRENLKPATPPISSPFGPPMLTSSTGAGTTIGSESVFGMTTLPAAAVLAGQITFGGSAFVSGFMA